MTALELERVRPLLEAEVQRLIDLLDQIDVDPDFEEGADLENDTADLEPLHGAPNQSAGSWSGIDASFGCDDGEELELGWTELEARFGRYQAAGDDVYEPSLGSTNSMSQIYWSRGRSGDLEDEHDGREDDPDFELQCEDEGAQCDDEGVIDGDQEGTDEAPCYAGPCSPISTMVGQF